MRLNLGCGTDIKQGWVNVDYVPGPGVDVVTDISKRLPFEDGTVEEIYISHVLEHIFNWPDVILECHRVLKANGRLEVRVPYGVGKHNPDAQHVRFFWPRTMDVFVNKESPALDMASLNGRFRMERCEVLRMLWYHSKIERYLHIHFFERCKYRFPLGLKKDMRWVLRKNGGR